MGSISLIVQSMEDIFESSKDGIKRRIKSRGLDQTENGLFDPHTDVTEVNLFMSFEWVKIDLWYTAFDILWWLLKLSRISTITSH